MTDVPPACALEVLGAFPDVGDRRPNGQPSALWLCDQAERLDGMVGGTVDVDRGWVRFDAICVPAEAGPALAAAVEMAEPEPGGTPPLELALAEAWVPPIEPTSKAIWYAHGEALLRATNIPYGTALVGLWWD